MNTAEAARRDTLASRVLSGAAHASDLFAIYLGSRLGYYTALADGVAVSSEGLARATKTSERYAREWLEQQAVAGVLDVVAASDDPKRRTYRLSPGHAEVLANETSSAYMAFFPRYFVAAGRVMPQILRAFQKGAGVSWSAYGDDVWKAQSEQNRTFLSREFVPGFVAAIPEVKRRLESDPPAQVADIACGAGWSTLALAAAFPKVRVDGFDLDRKALALARQNATEAGVSDRVRFHARDAARPGVTYKYDFATIVEAVHDLSRPVDVLRAVRRLLAPGGSLLVVDENVPERFEAPGRELDRIFYGFSLLACLPNGLADRPSAATGTVMRPATLKAYARKAGFGAAETLDLPHDFFRFYLLRP